MKNLLCNWKVRWMLKVHHGTIHATLFLRVLFFSLIMTFLIFQVGRPFAGAFDTLTVTTLVCPRSSRRYQNILTGVATLTCVTAGQWPLQAHPSSTCWRCSAASGPAASLHDFTIELLLSFFVAKPLMDIYIFTLYYYLVTVWFLLTTYKWKRTVCCKLFLF